METWQTHDVISLRRRGAVAMAGGGDKRTYVEQAGPTNSARLVISTVNSRDMCWIGPSGEGAEQSVDREGRTGFPHRARSLFLALDFAAA